MAVDYGREISCTTSMKTGRFVTGPRIVGEACYRRLTTPRGMLRGGEDEASYGLDLTELIGSTSSTSLQASLAGRIRAELEKDSRIESVSVDVLATAAASMATYTITIECVTGAGPFTLQVRASAVTVELLGLTEQ